MEDQGPKTVHLNREEIHDQLWRIVERFNHNLSTWMHAYDCVANFGWEFGGPQREKRLSITDIDYIIYRRPPPGEKTLGDILKAAESSAKT